MSGHRRRRVLACFLAAFMLVAASPLVSQSASAEETVSNPGLGGWDPAIQLDTNGFPVIAFTTFDPPELHVVRCSDAACIQPVTTAILPGRYAVPSLAIDSNDRPIVAALDLDVGQLAVVRCDDATCTSLSEIARPDDVLGLDASPSIVLTADDRPVIASWSKVTRTPRIIYCGDPACSVGNSIATPDLTTDTINGSHIRLTSAGLPVVVYPDFNLNQWKLLRCGNVSCTANNLITTVGSTSNNSNIALQLTSNDVPVFLMIGNDNIQLRACADPGCASFVTSFIAVGPAFFSDESLAFDADDNPVMAYLDFNAQDLILKRCTSSRCQMVTLGDEDYEGLTPAVAIDDDGFPVIAHRNVTRDQLEVTRCDDPDCSPAVPFVIADADCSRDLNILDAFAVAQYVVGSKASVASCEENQPNGEISLSAVSLDGGPVTIQNAFWVAQCVVELASPLCPDEPG